jgi:hypothetical protein
METLPPQMITSQTLAKKQTTVLWGIFVKDARSFFTFSHKFFFCDPRGSNDLSAGLLIASFIFFGSLPGILADHG